MRESSLGMGIGVPDLVGGGVIQGGMPSPVSLQGWGFFRSKAGEGLEIEQKAMGHSEQGTSVSLVR